MPLFSKTTKKRPARRAMGKSGVGRKAYNKRSTKRTTKKKRKTPRKVGRRNP